MPSLLHQALVSLFRNRPTLAPELVREALRQPLPDYDEVQLEDADLSQLTPTEYHADLVVLLRAADPVYAIVVEVQLGRDDDKPYSWPLYAAALRARLRCPTCVLVVAPDAAIARWASRPIEMGQPGSCFVPLVLGPESVPRVTDPKVAPELAVLSVQAHGREEDALQLVLTALQAVDVTDERGLLYCDLIWLAVGGATRRKLEELMANGTYTYQSDFAKKYIAEGEAKGEARGRAKGEARGLLKLVRHRLGRVPRGLGAKLEAMDAEALGQLFDRVLEAEDPDELRALLAALPRR